MLQAAPAPVHRRAAPLVPGLAVVVGLAALALAASALLPGVVAASGAVALGALLGSSGLHHAALRPGTRAAGHHLLRGAVVLLGLEVAVPDVVRLGGPGLAAVAVTVAVTFTGTRLLGRILGVPAPRALLVATGFSICGASAVAAMEPVAGGNEDDTSIAIALVTLCGSMAILVLPMLQAPLGLDATSFGSWVGASVHDVGQTVATANRVPGALETAVVVKLTRVLLLAPLVAVVALRSRRSSEQTPTRRPAVMPLFVAGFLVAVVVASTGLLPAPVIGASERVQGVLLTAALVGLGAGIRLTLLRRTGGRALALGLLAWLLVAAVAYAGVRILGY